MRSIVSYVVVCLVLCGLMLGCSKKEAPPKEVKPPIGIAPPQELIENTPKPEGVTKPVAKKETTAPARERIRGLWVGAKARISDPKKAEDIKTNYGPQGVANMEGSITKAVQGQTLEVGEKNVHLRLENGSKKSFTYTVAKEDGDTVVLKTVEDGGKVVHTTIQVKGASPTEILVTDDDAVQGVEVTFVRKPLEKKTPTPKETAP